MRVGETLVLVVARELRPAVDAVDEAKLADSSVRAWLSAAEESELRELLGGVTSEAMTEAARAWGAVFWPLTSDAGLRLEPWMVDDSVRNVVDHRRRAACRVWAVAHGVSSSDAAHRAGLGWC